MRTNSELVGAVSADYVDAVYDEEEVNNAMVSSEVKGESVGVGQEEVVKTSEENLQDILNNNMGEYANNSDLTKEEKEFFDLINANRRNNGLEELKIDGELQNIARLKAKDMVENNYFSHISEKYGNINDMLESFNITCEDVAENIAGNKTLNGVVEAWMQSENHKINILGSYNYTGVAIVESSTYGKIFVQVFMKK